jgi:hypothetical protein
MANRNAHFKDSVLFHGSDHAFSVGDIVEPRSYANVAYASTNRDVAAGYGKHVYKVEPMGEVTRQAGAAKEFGIYHSKDGFRVTGLAGGE